jgi:signal transduction histidine kinase/CheY-like chemotaxis protein
LRPSLSFPSTPPDRDGKAKTGVSGLDDILGGLTRGRVFLLEGEPGAGKTTIAVQFLLEGEKQGEKSLYITLSETEEELRQSAASHGWTLGPDINVFELIPPESLLDPKQQQSLLYSSDLELGETTQQIFDAVERTRPSRVVLDSLSEIRLLAQSSLRYRRQILAIKHYFARYGATVVMLDDLTAEPADKTVHSVAHGVIRLEELAPAYGAERRRIRILKYRGQRYRGGYHDAPFGYEQLLSSIHPEDLARMRAAVDQTLRTGKDYEIEYRNVWPDGTIHWIDARARALRTAAGAVNQLIGVSSDITERKTSELERERLLRELAAERAALSELTATLEERVNDRTAELTTEAAAREKAQDQLLQSQKMEAIGQLTGGVAHDFNNLLMAVIANLDLLRKRSQNDARAQRLIEGALRGAERGTTLTQRMLAFARQQELKASSADLPSLLDGLRDLLDRTLGPQIELTLDVPEGLPPAQVDPNQIELAILNLAINARDAMPNGGKIHISVRRAGSASGHDNSSKDFVLLSVSDTGSGMDEETLKKAIEPFFSTKPVGKGTGLGLSMVDGLVVQLGGRLQLTSQVGKGTTATLWLPVASKPASVRAMPNSSKVTPVRVATILVVDDDPLIANSTVNMLEDLGHTVIEANSARQALEILDQGQAVDLMMTDQAMPGMTGIELAETVMRKRPDLPILLATGYADLSAGHSLKIPRLSKPYLQAQLQEHVDRLLSRVTTQALIRSPRRHGRAASAGR